MTIRCKRPAIAVDLGPPSFLTERKHARDRRIIQRQLERKFGEPIGDGRNRLVFANDRTVYKFPITEQGYWDNTHEARLFRQVRGNTSDEVHLARCRVIFLRDIPILVMERVVQLPYKDQPEWCDFVDGGQVGRNRLGCVVAYDFADL